MRLTYGIIALLAATLAAGPLSAGAPGPATHRDAAPSAGAVVAAADVMTTAERLLQLAEKKQLSAEQAARAAALLRHDDPFVRGVAEWAIATKVGQENDGQEIRWPRPDPPDWFRQWSALDADFLLEADYVRQAFVWNIHHDGGLDFTASEGPDGFYQSFRTMFGTAPGRTKPGQTLVAVSDRFSNADVSRPKQFGSHKSPLVLVLLNDELHKKEVRLSAAEWLSLVTWVDANAPYYDRFINKRPPDGGQPRRDVVWQR